MSRKPCSKCGGAQGVRPGGLCNKCFTVASNEVVSMYPLKNINTADVVVPPGRDRDMGDLEGDAATVREVGLLHPILVSADLHLLFGLRRLRMCTTVLQWDTIPAFVYPAKYADIDPLTVYRIMQVENDNRKDPTHSEKVVIARGIEKLLRGRVGRPTKEEIKVETPELSEQDKPKGQSRDIAAKTAGFTSPNTYRAAAAVVDSGDKELIEAMDSGEIAPTPAAEIAKLPDSERPEAIKRKRNREPVQPPRTDSRPEDAESKTDGVGKPIPPRLRNLFNTKIFEDMVSRYLELHKELKRRYEDFRSFWGANPNYVDSDALDAMERMADDAKVAADNIRNGIPFVVHPPCGGKGCDDCSNTGYWPRWRYENHQEMKAGA